MYRLIWTYIHFWFEFEFNFHFGICQSVMFDSIFKKQRWKFIVYTAYLDSPFFFISIFIFLRCFFFFLFHFLYSFFIVNVNTTCVYFECEWTDKDGMMPIKRNSNTLMFLLCVHFYGFTASAWVLKIENVSRFPLFIGRAHLFIEFSSCPFGYSSHNWLRVNWISTQFQIAASKISQFCMDI